MTAHEPSRGRPPSRRPTVAIVVGVALVVLVLVAAVISLRSKNDPGGQQATPTTVAVPPDGESTTAPNETSAEPGASGGPATTTTTSSSVDGAPTSVVSDAGRKAAEERLVAAIPAFGPVPAGDYGPVCAELLDEAAGSAPLTDLSTFIDLLRRLDLPKLAELAPPGIRPAWAQLVELSPGAEEATRRADGAPAPEDLPPGFLAALGEVLNTVVAECPSMDTGG